MTNEEITVYLIKGLISELPADKREAVNELADHIRRFVAQAGDTVGPIAISLVGAELAVKGKQP